MMGRTYRLIFEGPLVGRVEGLNNGFAKKLETLIRSRLDENPDCIKDICKDYPPIQSFLETIGATNLDNFLYFVYWEGLLGAWKAIEKSHCLMHEKIILKIDPNKMEILEGTLRAGLHVTDYHEVKNSLFNTGIQTALYTCLKALGLLTWSGYTAKPLHLIFSISALQLFPDKEGVYLHVSSNTDERIEFKFDSSWQTPQNLPQKDLEHLAKYPWHFVKNEELGFIAENLAWSVAVHRGSF